MKKVALLVGVEEYQDPDISSLKYVRSDVHALADALRETCGFDAVGVLADADGNTCEHNDGAGIPAFGRRTPPVLSANECHNNRLWGIYRGEGAKPQVERDNRATGNEKGQIR